jgi:hypothetical protein
MQGHARLVERKIRVWIVQQERNRQKQGQPIRIDAPTRPMSTAGAPSACE